MSKTNSDPHWDADLYKKNSVLLQQTSALALIEQLDIQKNDHILDVGCGDGKITVELAKKVIEGEVTGFDLSEDMITLAQKEFNNMPNLSFSLGDAVNFQYKKKFDWVMSFFCLQWVNNKQDSFKQILAHLKPQGKIAVITTDRNPLLLEIRASLIRKEEFKDYFINYTDATDVIDEDDYQAYAANVGFENIAFSEYKKTIFFDDESQLRAFIKMVTPALKYLPTENLKDNFSNQLADKYLSIAPEMNNTKNYITYTVKTLLANNQAETRCL